MKRANTDPSPKSNKRHRVDVKDMDSLHDQAKQYRLVTASFPIDSLDPNWSFGTNRAIDEAHKRRLCQIFKDEGVLRRDARHRLHVACSKAQVQKMLDYLKQRDSQPLPVVTATGDAGEADAQWLCFEGWDIVVGEKAELIAGHHRVEAFKEHLRRLQSPESERWWVCNIYDKGTEPLRRHPRHANVR